MNKVQCLEEMAEVQCLEELDDKTYRAIIAGMGGQTGGIDGNGGFGGNGGIGGKGGTKNTVKTQHGASFNGVLLSCRMINPSLPRQALCRGARSRPLWSWDIYQT